VFSLSEKTFSKNVISFRWGVYARYTHVARLPHLGYNELYLPRSQTRKVPTPPLLLVSTSALTVFTSAETRKKSGIKKNNSQTRGIINPSVVSKFTS